MRMNQIEPVSYNQRRSKYFRERIEHCERCMNWWSKYDRLNKYSWLEIEEQCSSYGEMINFYRDALQALGESA